jgi:hypothetical protein
MQGFLQSNVNSAGCISIYLDFTYAMLLSLGARPLSRLSQLHLDMPRGSDLKMKDQAFKHSTTPASLSIFFSDLSADYKYSDTGLGAAGYMSSGDVFYFSWEIIEKTLQLFVPTRGLHSVSVLFQKVHTTRRSQEPLHDFTQESTRTKLVPTQQDLKKQDEASKSSNMKCSEACWCGTHGVPRKGREKI